MKKMDIVMLNDNSTWTEVRDCYVVLDLPENALPTGGRITEWKVPKISVQDLLDFYRANHKETA